MDGGVEFDPDDWSVANGLVHRVGELTIAFVANQQPGCLRKQQRGG